MGFKVLAPPLSLTKMLMVGERKLSCKLQFQPAMQQVFAIGFSYGKISYFPA